MAVSMMDTFSPLLRYLDDQMENTRSFCVMYKDISEKFSFMEGKISNIEKKIDQQQITIEKLFKNDISEIAKEKDQQEINMEELVKKDNIIENSQTEASFQNKTTIADKTDNDNEDTKHLEKLRENIDAYNFDNTSKAAHISSCETDNICEEDDKNNIEQVDNIQDKIKEMIKELKEIKEIIKPLKVTLIPTNETGVNCEDDNKNNTEKTGYEIGQYITNELKQIKELIKNLEAMRKNEDTANVAKQATVKISPTYFNEDQISKLNCELKNIAEKYRSTNMPNIEVLPGSCEDNPIMKQLREGVEYKHNTDHCTSYAVKLGINGFKATDVRNMVTEYPDLTLSEVIWELLNSRNLLADLKKKYFLYDPEPLRGRHSSNIVSYYLLP